MKEKPKKKDYVWNARKVSNAESKKWYDLAVKQNFKTLPDFIKKVREAFPGYQPYPPETATKKEIEAFQKEQRVRYINGVFAGILISYAAFHATSNTYGYSCNQAGVVRNSFYRAIFDEKINYEQL